MAVGLSGCFEPIGADNAGVDDGFGGADGAGGGAAIAGIW